MTTQEADLFQRRVLDLGRIELNKLLVEWLAESTAKDMNSNAALSNLIGTVFTRGLKFGVQICQKVERGEL